MFTDTSSGRRSLFHSLPRFRSKLTNYIATKKRKKKCLNFFTTTKMFSFLKNIRLNKKYKLQMGRILKKESEKSWRL